MTKYKLGNLTKIYTGKLNANAAVSDGEFPFFTCSREISRIDHYSYDCECVLVAGNGDLNVKYYDGKFDAYQRTYIIESNGNNILYMPYLYYFMSSYVERLREQTIGGVIKYIKLNNLTDAKIDLPSLIEQKKIVDILNKARAINTKRSNELKKLDTLIKARFVEMFGDPICNSKNKNTTKFINIVKLQRGFDLPIRRRNKNGEIPIYGSNGIVGYHDQSKARHGIITGRSGTIGQVYSEQDEYWPLNTSLFSVETYGNDIIYLQYLLQLFHLERFYNGAGVPTLNRNDVHKETIIRIPLSEQKVFSQFVQQVDKSKVAIQKSLDETQTLFDSLMQKYFS